MAIQYTSEEKKYVLLKGNILKRMEAERVSDAQMATATGMAVRTYKEKKLYPEKFTYPELRTLVYNCCSSPENPSTADLYSPTFVSREVYCLLTASYFSVTSVYF